MDGGNAHKITSAMMETAAQIACPGRPRSSLCVATDCSGLKSFESPLKRGSRVSQTLLPGGSSVNGDNYTVKEKRET